MLSGSNQIKMKNFTIGKVPVNSPFVLAPMSGVTNSAFRKLIKQENQAAVGLMVTEFISIEGLTRENRQSLERMRFAELERPISIQIFGYDISRMVDSALMVQDAGADIIDINCGCPVPKVVRRGGGCELMRQSEHLAKILRATRKAVSIPLTLKIRSGWDNENRNGLEIAKMAESEGVDMLAMHGRTRTSLYRGDCDWKIIGEVAQNLSIPVIGSGDVVDYDSAKSAFNSGVTALMIGRGALTNPWIFKELHAAFTGEDYIRPPDTATVDILFTYRDLLSEVLPEKAVIGRLKQLASQATRRVHGSTRARRALCLSKTVDEFSETLLLWREWLESRREYRDMPEFRQAV